MAHDLSLLIPEMLLAVTVVLMLVSEMLRAPRLALGIGVIGLGLVTALTLPLLETDTSVFGGTYRIDLLSAWAKLILLPGTALALLMARAEIVGKDCEGSVYALLCLVTLGALMLSGGGDMMMLVLGVVLTGLGSFALVAWPRGDPATEAAMKYLVFGSVTGSVMIYGLSFCFDGTGSTLFSKLGLLEGRTLIALAGLTAVLIVFGAAYVAMNLGAFAVIMVAGRRLDDFRGFGRARPVMGVAMVVFLLSLTGIPPLFGFGGKMLLFDAAIEAGYLWLAVIGILISVVALAVYLCIVLPMYQPSEAGQGSAAPAPPLIILLGATALVTLFIGLLAEAFPG